MAVFNILLLSKLPSKVSYHYQVIPQILDCFFVCSLKLLTSEWLYLLFWLILGEINPINVNCMLNRRVYCVSRDRQNFLKLFGEMLKFGTGRVNISKKQFCIHWHVILLLLDTKTIQTICKDNWKE
jgi:hypothetical protein